MSFVTDAFSGILGGGGGGGLLGAVAGPLGSVISGGITSRAASQGQSAADPFASQRGQYQGRLSALYNDPNYIFSDPSYRFRLNQGLQGVQGSAAAQGMLNSGNTLSALANYSQGLASSEFQNEEQRLAQLSGATIGSPGVAANYANQSSLANGGGISSGIGGLLNNLGGLFGGGSTNLGLGSYDPTGGVGNFGLMNSGFGGTSAFGNVFGDGTSSLGGGSGLDITSAFGNYGGF